MRRFDGQYFMRYVAASGTVDWVNYKMEHYVGYCGGVIIHSFFPSGKLGGGMSAQEINYLSETQKPLAAEHNKQFAEMQPLAGVELAKALIDDVKTFNPGVGTIFMADRPIRHGGHMFALLPTEEFVHGLYVWQAQVSDEYVNRNTGHIMRDCIIRSLREAFPANTGTAVVITPEQMPAPPAPNQSRAAVRMIIPDENPIGFARSTNV